MRVTAIAVLALAAAGCGGQPSLVMTQRLRIQSLPPVDIELRLQPEHQRDGVRRLQAAAATLRTMGVWLAPYPAASLTIVDPPWRGGASAPAGAIVLQRSPWWTTPTAMAPELATARPLAREYWARIIDTRALPAWFVEGLAEYTARRIVLGLFARDNNSPGYAMFEPRYFGGFVPRFVRIRLMPDADGDPLDAYRTHPEAAAARTVLTLQTLEQWVSRPLFDAALAEFVRESHSAPPTLDAFVRVTSAVSGQDLSWLFAQTLSGSRVFDYSVASLTSDSVSAAAGRFETRVTVERRGDAIFAGTAVPPAGVFDSGKGVSLRVTFVDGQTLVDHWDGRDTSRTFVFRSRARARSAEVDPDRSLPLDVHRVNDSVTLDPHSAIAARRWSARWLTWFEHLLLEYAFFA